MPSYIFIALLLTLGLLGYVLRMIHFYVLKERLKHTETRMHSAENEVIKLNKLILILVTPKPKNPPKNPPIVKEIQRVIGDLEAAELQGFNKGYERGREYQIRQTWLRTLRRRRRIRRREVDET